MVLTNYKMSLESKIYQLIQQNQELQDQNNSLKEKLIKMDCNKWEQSKSSSSPINPLTGRKIKPNGPTFKKIDNICKSKGQNKRQNKPKSTPKLEMMEFSDRSNEVSDNSRKFDLVLKDSKNVGRYTFEISMSPLNKEILETVYDKVYDSFRLGMKVPL